MGISEHDALLIDACTDLLVGTILLLGLMYTYFKIYKLRNLNFMTKLLVMMLSIALTEIYTGILLISYIKDASWAGRSTTLAVVDGIVNVIYEINTILITWIVGFQFHDSAKKLLEIEAHFEESKMKYKSARLLK